MTLIPQITIATKKKFVRIYSPYSATNIAYFRKFNGFWKSEFRAWILPKSPEAEQMVADLFGKDSPSVKVRVNVEQTEKLPLEYTLGGYVLCTRREPKSRWEFPASVVFRPVAERAFFELVVRRDFAEREKLEILETGDGNRAMPALPNT